MFTKTPGKAWTDNETENKETETLQDQESIYWPTNSKTKSRSRKLSSGGIYFLEVRNTSHDKEQMKMSGINAQSVKCVFFDDGVHACACSPND